MVPAPIHSCSSLCYCSAVLALAFLLATAGLPRAAGNRNCNKRAVITNSTRGRLLICGGGGGGGRPAKQGPELASPEGMWSDCDDGSVMGDGGASVRIAAEEALPAEELPQASEQGDEQGDQEEDEPEEFDIPDENASINERALPRQMQVRKKPAFAAGQPKVPKVRRAKTYKGRSKSFKLPRGRKFFFSREVHGQLKLADLLKAREKNAADVGKEVRKASSRKLWSKSITQYRRNRRSNKVLAVARQAAPKRKAASYWMLRLEDLEKKLSQDYCGPGTSLPGEEKGLDPLYQARLDEGKAKIVDVCLSARGSQRLYILEKEGGKQEKSVVSAPDIFALLEKESQTRLRNLVGSDPLLRTKVWIENPEDTKWYEATVTKVAYFRSYATTSETSPIRKLYLVQHTGIIGYAHLIWTATQVRHAEALLPLDAGERSWDPVWEAPVSVDGSGPGPVVVDVKRSAKTWDRVYIVNHSLPGYPGHVRFTALEVADALNPPELPKTALSRTINIKQARSKRSAGKRKFFGRCQLEGTVERTLSVSVLSARWSSRIPKQLKVDIGWHQQTRSGTSLHHRHLLLVSYRVEGTCAEGMATWTFYDVVAQVETEGMHGSSEAAAKRTCCCAESDQGAFAVNVHDDVAVGHDGWANLKGTGWGMGLAMAGQTARGPECPRLSIEAKPLKVPDFLQMALKDGRVLNVCACTKSRFSWDNEEQCGEERAEADSPRHVLSKPPGEAAWRGQCPMLCYAQGLLPEVEKPCSKTR